MIMAQYFVLTLNSFICYHTNIPLHADMDSRRYDYGRKEIDIANNSNAWLRPYFWIPIHYHPDGSVDGDFQRPHQ